MARKKPTYQPRHYESSDTKDIFVSLYASMINSEAFNDLKPRAKVLLLYMRYHIFASPKAHEITPQLRYRDDGLFQDNKYIFFSRYYWHDKYKLYTNGNYFYQDKESLIRHGFISEVANGKNQRIQSVFCMDDGWKTWKKNNTDKQA